jgi:hypothetical protein
VLRELAEHPGNVRHVIPRIGIGSAWLHSCLLMVAGVLKRSAPAPVTVDPEP